MKVWFLYTLWGALSILAQADDNVIPDQYIVLLDDHFDKIVTRIRLFLSNEKRPKLLREYRQGIVVSGLTGEVAERWARDPAVLSIVPDMKFFAASTTQSNPPSWGLDRIDQASRRLDSNYTYEWTGLGVQVYILDSGIQASHVDFADRVICGLSTIPDGDSCVDGFGHGTHVAGIVGGTQYGVAKEVDLVSVQVLNENGEGSLSGMLLALDYVMDQKAASPDTPMVINFSLSGSHHPLLDEAIEQVVQANITVVAAAGNHNQPACDYSPGSAASAITVGATNTYDYLLSFSNYGACVDLLAPGVDIVSADSRSNTGQRTETGTSQAAPHVAGVAALYLQTHPMWTPATVREAILEKAVDRLQGTRIENSTTLILQTLL
ncbi:proprotein convertase subtilisin/kexin type 9 [Fistulifera solaris]|uniref:subtilisin n=1 Tax=Fistulifera solaris TaxID=1519565 RepID=A0A1Z5KCQ7_FISSO|nr:proprotein convertase subtilisin/kexin type 9 [Fistulifera solaris]|eukprot:GAX24017.1 proprotein convertase subtilisin/kexin type 9 [Fistulifera solaris]